MRISLPVIICLLAVSGVSAQIKGDPEIKGRPQLLNFSRSSSKLSPELKRSHEKYGRSLQESQLSVRQRPFSGAFERLTRIKGDKVCKG